MKRNILAAAIAASLLTACGGGSSDDAMAPESEALPMEALPMVEPEPAPVTMFTEPNPVGYTFGTGGAWLQAIHASLPYLDLENQGTGAIVNLRGVSNSIVETPQYPEIATYNDLVFYDSDDDAGNPNDRNYYYPRGLRWYEHCYADCDTNEPSYLAFAAWLDYTVSGESRAKVVYGATNGATSTGGRYNSRSGTATLEGHTLGFFRDTDNSLWELHGDVQMVATLGGDQAPVRGRMDNFEVGGKSKPWVVEMSTTTYGNWGAFSGSVSGSGFSGTWVGHLKNFDEGMVVAGGLDAGNSEGRIIASLGAKE